jgi:hypothetical protein
MFYGFHMINILGNFFSVLSHLNSQKPTNQQGKITNKEKNKTHADILKQFLIIKVSHSMVKDKNQLMDDDVILYVYLF